MNHNDPNDIRQVKDFLKCHQLAVIATGGDSGVPPESALIAFVEDDELAIYFQTSRYSRKAQNLIARPHVSLVIGLDLAEMQTLQYEGVASQLQSATEIAACKQRFLAKNSPTTPRYLERDDALLFKIIPTWISYSSYPDNAAPGQIKELILSQRGALRRS